MRALDLLALALTVASVALVTPAAHAQAPTRLGPKLVVESWELVRVRPGHEFPATRTVVLAITVRNVGDAPMPASRTLVAFVSRLDPKDQRPTELAAAPDQVTVLPDRTKAFTRHESDTPPLAPGQAVTLFLPLEMPVRVPRPLDRSFVVLLDWRQGGDAVDEIQKRIDRPYAVLERF